MSKIWKIVIQEPQIPEKVKIAKGGRILFVVPEKLFLIS